MKKTSFIAILSTALFFSSMLSAGNVYKWTDADGVTHYGDKKPANYQAESIRMRSRADATTEQKTEEEKEKTKTSTTKSEPKSPSLSPEIVAEMKKSCEEARKNLQVIAENARIRMEVEGEIRYLSPEEISAQKSRLEDIVKKTCL